MYDCEEGSSGTRNEICLLARVVGKLGTGWTVLNKNVSKPLSVNRFTRCSGFDETKNFFVVIVEG